MLVTCKYFNGYKPCKFQKRYKNLKCNENCKYKSNETNAKIKKGFKIVCGKILPYDDAYYLWRVGKEIEKN